MLELRKNNYIKNRFKVTFFSDADKNLHGAATGF